MKIKINPLIILFIVYFYCINQIETYLSFILFILLHELGHIIVGSILGFKLKCIKIIPWGISIKFKEEYDDVSGRTKRNLKKMIVAFAGPAMNIISFIILINIKIKFVEFIYANLIIAIFNLLPIYPLDGGRILEGILDIKFEYDKKNKYINGIANLTMVILTIIASVLLVYYENILIFLGILYMWFIIFKERNKKLTI